jgi:hypothetical protein
MNTDRKLARMSELEMLLVRAKRGVYLCDQTEPSVASFQDKARIYWRQALAIEQAALEQDEEGYVRECNFVLEILEDQLCRMNNIRHEILGHTPMPEDNGGNLRECGCNRDDRHSCGGY